MLAYELAWLIESGNFNATFQLHTSRKARYEHPRCWTDQLYGTGQKAHAMKNMMMMIIMAPKLRKNPFFFYKLDIIHVHIVSLYAGKW